MDGWKVEDTCNTNLKQISKRVLSCTVSGQGRQPKQDRKDGNEGEESGRNVREKKRNPRQFVTTKHSSHLCCCLWQNIFTSLQSLFIHPEDLDVCFSFSSMSQLKPAYWTLLCPFSRKQAFLFEQVQTRAHSHGRQRSSSIVLHSHVHSPRAPAFVLKGWTRLLKQLDSNRDEVLWPISILTESRTFSYMIPWHCNIRHFSIHFLVIYRRSNVGKQRFIDWIITNIRLDKLNSQF